jgi:hypothetical protein
MRRNPATAHRRWRDLMPKATNAKRQGTAPLLAKAARRRLKLTCTLPGGCPQWSVNHSASPAMGAIAAATQCLTPKSKRCRCRTGAKRRPTSKALPDLPIDSQPTMDLPPKPARTLPAVWKIPAMGGGSAQEGFGIRAHRRFPTPGPPIQPSPSRSRRYPRRQHCLGRRNVVRGLLRVTPACRPFEPPRWPPSPTSARYATFATCTTRRRSPLSPSSHPHAAMAWCSSGSTPGKERPITVVLAHCPGCSDERAPAAVGRGGGGEA